MQRTVRLIDLIIAEMIAAQGCRLRTGAPMSTKGIDQKTGMVNVYELLPEQGDSIMIVNCGTHFELHHHHWEQPPLVLTEEDIEAIRSGRVVWN